MKDRQPAAAGQEIIYEVRDRIGRVTFNRPEARNALTFGMYDRLAEICATVPANGSVMAIVITGAGERAFAAGTDISLFRDFRTPEQGIRYEKRADEVFTAIESCPVPTIAAIAGACTGGGLGIAGCCDIRLCDQGARFGLPIAKTLGNILNMHNFARFYALVGPAAIAEMIMTSRLFSAAEAKHIGLVSEVLDTPDAVAARAMELATTMKDLAPLTLKATKEALRRLRKATSDVEGDDLVTMCFTSADFQEGVDAFLNKRAPKFQGR